MVMLLVMPNMKKFKSEKNGTPLSSASATGFSVDYPFIEADAGTKAAVATSAGSMILASAISFGASVIGGGSLELMWSMVNTLQIIYYIGLMKLYYPAHVHVFFGYLGLSNMDNEVIALLTQMIFGDIFFVSNPVNG